MLDVYMHVLHVCGMGDPPIGRDPIELFRIYLEKLRYRYSYYVHVHVLDEYMYMMHTFCPDTGGEPHDSICGTCKFFSDSLNFTQKWYHDQDQASCKLCANKFESRAQERSGGA